MQIKNEIGYLKNGEHTARPRKTWKCQGRKLRAIYAMKKENAQQNKWISNS